MAYHEMEQEGTKALVKILGRASMEIEPLSTQILPQPRQKVVLICSYSPSICTQTAPIKSIVSLLYEALTEM